MDEQRAMADTLTALLSWENPACECAELNPAAVQQGQDPCIRHLLPIQGWHLWEAFHPESTGILGMISAGGGKTGVGILLPMVIPGCKTALLLVPPSLRKQFGTDYRRWAQHFRVPNLAGGPGPFYADRPVLEVMAYSMLSRPEQTAYLDARQPDVIIADEAQALGGYNKSAIARRVIRYKAEHPDVRHYLHSGSLAGDGVEKWWHLSMITLHEGSPLPLEHEIAQEWGGAIDPLPDRLEDRRAPLGALKKLCAQGETVREGFQRRLTETFGVISSREVSIKTLLQIRERKAPSVPQVIADTIRYVKENAERPDEETLMDAMEIATTCRKVAYGFYHRWRFPHVYDAQGNEVEDDEGRYKVVEEWRAARKAWMRELRHKLERATEHMDSEMLVRNAAIRFHEGYKGPLPVWKSACWPAWSAIKDRVEYVPDTVWIDDYLVRDAAEWARSNLGIVWCLHGSFSRALAKMTGLPRYGADAGKVENLNPTPEMLRRRDAKVSRGEKWEDKPSDWIEVEDGSRSIIASIKAHGTGKNLQAWNHCLFANLPASGEAWEQTMAREHRRGQPRDIVFVDVYQHLPELVDALAKARGDALYKQHTEGAQRLLYATYDFDPP